MKFWEASGNDFQVSTSWLWLAWKSSRKLGLLSTLILQPLPPLSLLNCNSWQHECVYTDCTSCTSFVLQKDVSHQWTCICKNNKTYLIFKLSAFRSSSSCDSLSVFSFLSSNFWILQKNPARFEIRHWISQRNNKRQLSNFYTYNRSSS